MKKFKFTIRGTKYDVEVKDFDNNIAEIEVNGTKYEVEVHKEIKKTKTPTIVRDSNGDEKPKAAPEKKAVDSSSDSKTRKVKAPLPGNILNVKVNEGDSIKQGDVLLIMEAMKMENNVLAEKEGVIKSIKVSEGDAVLQNDVLIEIE